MKAIKGTTQATIVCTLLVQSLRKGR